MRSGYSSLKIQGKKIVRMNLIIFWNKFFCIFLEKFTFKFTFFKQKKPLSDEQQLRRIYTLYFRTYEANTYWPIQNV